MVVVVKGPLCNGGWYSLCLGPGAYLFLPLKCSGGFGDGRLFLIPLSSSSSLGSVHEAPRLKYLARAAPVAYRLPGCLQ